MDNTAQIDYWNGPAGQKWVRDADRLDQMLAPFAEAVLASAKLQAGDSVVDIGCGAGALSLMASASGAHVQGVDVSAPLIDLASRRAQAAGTKASFLVADASGWSPGAKVSHVISRFGVMFFAEPVAAFANIRSMAKPGGRLTFACWRPLSENEWALAPIVAALPFLKEPPQPPPPGSPGPFAFGGADHVRQILGESGWSDVQVSPWDGQIELPGSNADETADFMLDIGPLSRAIAEQGVDRGLIKDALTGALQKLDTPNGRARLKAAVWIVGASA